MRLFKYTLITIAIVAIVYLIFLALISNILSFPDETYTKKNLIDNFNLKKKEIQLIKDYAKSIIPKDKVVSIEFENENHLALFHLSNANGYSNNWDLSINSSKTDSLLNILKWPKSNLYVLKRKLDDANCISIENRKNFHIGYQRSGMGMYSYILFNKKLSDSLKNEYNDGCNYI